MADYIILDGSTGYFLQENGGKILLEQQPGTTSPPAPPPPPTGGAGLLDSVNPVFFVDSEQQIHMTIELTQAQVTNQGYTYNQPGFTYNQPGVMYGGIYNVNQDVAPIFRNDTASLLIPSISSIINVDSHPVIPATDRNSLVPVGLPFYFLTYP